MDADATPGASSNRSSGNAARRWRNLGPAARDAITRSAWCSHCRTAVEIVDFELGELADDLLLRGRCGVCGGPVARHVENPDTNRLVSPAPAAARSASVDSDPFPGLDPVAARRLTAAAGVWPEF